MVLSFPCAGLQGLLSPKRPALCYGLMEQALLESSTGCILDLPLYYKSVDAVRRYLKSINCIYSVHHSERLHSEGSTTRHSCCKKCSLGFMLGQLNNELEVTSKLSGAAHSGSLWVHHYEQRQSQIYGLQLKLKNNESESCCKDTQFETFNIH